MRLLFAVVVVLVISGCAAPAANLQGASTATPMGDKPSPTPAGESGAATAQDSDQKAFCQSESGCKFWDEQFHEYVLYNVDTYNVNVFIVPSASPNATKDTQTMKAAAQAWADGIKQLGQPWFATKFKMNIYVLGQDTPPQDALQHPTIIILAAEYNKAVLFGIGIEPKQLLCSSIGQGTILQYPTHSHDGFQIQAADCTGTGFLCMAINTNFLLGSDVYMQDLVAHEFGHCLGGGHVGDALDFSAKRVPIQDIMSYQHNDSQIHCVSDLNVRVLENLYAPLMGQNVTAPLKAGDSYAMNQSEYQHAACKNPT